MKEAHVQKWVKDQLKARYPDCYVIKVAQGRYSTAGVPDLVACIDGKFVAIEVKTEKGKLSKLQEIAIESIREAGGVVEVIYGKDEKQMIYIYCEIE